METTHMTAEQNKESDLKYQLSIQIETVFYRVNNSM